MTDREKFQKTFSKLHASPDLLTEVVEMAEEKQVITKKRRYHIPKAAVAAIACVVVLGSGTAAYAMNVGGIQRTIQIWIHGDQTDAQFVVEDGSYTLDYEDENGEAVHRGGGGVAIEDDGIERPATEEEKSKRSSGKKCSLHCNLYLPGFRDRTVRSDDSCQERICLPWLCSTDHTVYSVCGTCDRNERERDLIGA